jgi:predicted metal-dependent phosphoesterase TrpH
LGLTEISITDHDAVGAYFHFHDDLFARAREFGLNLVAGVELDSEFDGVEIHILGYHIDPAHTELNRYLGQVQGLRRQRVADQIRQINEHFDREIVSVDKVFAAHRDTVMNPHLVHALLDSGHFTEYRPAARWIKENITPAVTVPKPTCIDMIRLVHQAGGQAVLAHPGYYIKEHQLSLDRLLAELLPAGLDGLEVDYRYRSTSPFFASLADETAMVEYLRGEARRNGLWITRGSDAHRIAELKAFHSPPTSA